MEETRADTAVLMRSTRGSRLQSDHVNELPDFDEKTAEGEDSVSDSAILSVTYKKLRKTHVEATARTMRCKNAIKFRVSSRATKSVSYLIKATDFSS
jgi:hypothetical protein